MCWWCVIISCKWRETSFCCSALYNTQINNLLNMSQQIISSRKNHIADFQGILLIKANHLLKPTFFLLLPWFRDLSSSFHPSIYGPSILEQTEVGIYKRKQESQKTRTRPRKRSRKKEKSFFFSWSLSWSSFCFLVILFSYFLVLFYKFPPLGSRLWRRILILSFI